MNDPLDEVFETHEQSLAIFLKSMPKALIPVFEHEFMRRLSAPVAPLAQTGPTKDALDGLNVRQIEEVEQIVMLNIILAQGESPRR